MIKGLKSVHYTNCLKYKIKYVYVILSLTFTASLIYALAVDSAIGSAGNKIQVTLALLFISTFAIMKCKL